MEVMKSLTQELWMNVPERRAIVSIHEDVIRLVAESGVQEGLVLVNTKPTWDTLDFSEKTIAAKTNP
ncbi:MAG: hypothetical protein SH868_12285 [Bythopirellula sp.]|nr:hypothetical protein [Bythopirellula sp.]